MTVPSKGGDPLGPPPRPQRHTGGREPTTPDGPHPSLIELAELDEGLLDEPRTASVETHVRGCADCTQHRAGLRAVGPALSAVPAPHLPPAVADRLDSVLAGEVARRERRRSLRVADDGSDDGSGPVGWTTPTLGHFGADLPRRSRRRVLLPALAAAAVAAVIGFGAYVVSASAGLNEPPVVSAVSSRSLADQASALERSRDLDPHRFSRAWQCARQATSGRIVALASTTFDGTPALLVYTRTGATTVVTVVTGCETGRPTPRQSAPVADR